MLTAQKVGKIFMTQLLMFTGNPAFISATGGTITTSGDFKIHTFTGDGCFVVTQGSSAPNNNVSYMVVAGGGGGGSGGHLVVIMEQVVVELEVLEKDKLRKHHLQEVH